VAASNGGHFFSKKDAHSKHHNTTRSKEESQRGRVKRSLRNNEVPIKLALKDKALAKRNDPFNPFFLFLNQMNPHTSRGQTLKQAK
jgi:hypothetical protein